MQSEQTDAAASGPPTQQEMAARIDSIKAVMANGPMAAAMKYLHEHPGDLGSATSNPRGYLEGRGVNIPATFDVTIRQGNSYTVCLSVAGYNICVTVG